MSQVLEYEAIRTLNTKDIDIITNRLKFKLPVGGRILILYLLINVPVLCGARSAWSIIICSVELFNLVNDKVLLAAWAHYLIFDLFVGTWIAKKCLEEKSSNYNGY